MGGEDGADLTAEKDKFFRQISPSQIGFSKTYQAFLLDFLYPDLKFPYFPLK